jgi:predicted outer membrane repeat protein
MRPAWVLWVLAACDGDPDDGAPDGSGTADTEDTDGPTPGDVDGDGVSATGGDCDDADPLVHPGAEERCDGIDTDCDATTPEPVQRATVDHGGNHDTIAAALDAAGDDAVVTVCAGTYAEALRIERPLTLRGLGVPVLDGGGLGATIEVSAAGMVTIEGFEITGGSGGGPGPGVSNGGGIDAWMATGAVSVARCTIRDNLAEVGGGIVFGSAGGALTDSVVQGNVAGIQAGGVYAGGDLAIDGCVLSDNVSGGDGGGLLVGDGVVVTLADTEITGNTATRGGGAYGLGGSRFDFAGTAAITGNEASAFGGGLYVFETEVVGGTIEDNDAALGGGGMYVVDGGTLDGVSVLGNRSPSGAGLTVSGTAVLELTAVVIDGNVASDAGGGLYAISTTIDADDATLVSGNTAVDDGGGVVLYEATWKGGTISGNSASEGGGVFVGSGGGLSTLDGATVEENTATLSSGYPPVASGGGVWTAGVLDVTGASIERNLSDLRGAGLYATLDARVNVTDTSFDSNAAVERGGGLYTNGASTLTCTGCTIERNQALRGAGIYNNDVAAITVIDSEITANGSPATLSGGGARVTSGVLFSSCTDWGVAATENLPDDVFVEGEIEGVVGYGSCATFSCTTDDACVPSP